MEDRPRRRVYDSGLILQRRPVITAVAVSEDGRRAFLGLEGGLLEEYAIESSNESVAASLTARKPVVFKVSLLFGPLLSDALSRSQTFDIDVESVLHFINAATYIIDTTCNWGELSRITHRRWHAEVYSFRHLRGQGHGERTSAGRCDIQ